MVSGGEIGEYGEQVLEAFSCASELCECYYLQWLEAGLVSYMEREGVTNTILLEIPTSSFFLARANTAFCGRWRAFNMVLVTSSILF